MKKIICAAVVAAMLLSSCAFGADVQIIDAGKNVISVKGEAGVDENVSVMIINPGYESDDVLTNGKYAVAYFGKTVADSDGFSIDVRMTDPHGIGGGNYTLIYSYGDSITTDTFDFYFYEKKLEVIEKLNTEGAEGYIPEAYKIYGLDSSELYSAVAPETIEAIISKRGTFEEDPDEMLKELNIVLAIAAYSEGQDLLVKDGFLAYTDVVGIDDAKAYDDYKNNISDEGIADVNELVLSKTYETEAEIVNAFNEATILNAVVCPKEAGYTHMSGIFTKYGDELKAYGIDKALLDSVRNKSYVYRQMVDSNAQTMLELVSAYAQAIEEAGNLGSSGESSGSTIPVQIKNASKDLICLSADAQSGETVSVMIINPGFASEDILIDGKNAVAFFGKSFAGTDGFTIDVRMTDPHNFGGGNYTLIYSVGDKTQTETFNYYFFDKKMEMIEKLNSDGAEGNIAEVCKIYSLDSSELYKAVSIRSVEDILSKRGTFEADPDKMLQELNISLCVAAYSEGQDLLIKDGFLAYTDVVGISDTKIYDDYMNSFSSAGIKRVNEMVLSDIYDNEEEIVDAFNEAALLCSIVHPKTLGHGHVEEVFEKYGEELEAYGIDTSLMEGVSNKSYVYKQLGASKANNLDDLASVYEKAVAKADNTQPAGGSGGGGGGGGGSSSGSGSTVTLPADGPGMPNVTGPAQGSGYNDNTTHSFTDMTGYEWANDAVAVLYRRSIISGKSQTDFDPAGLVTREEFAKMAVLAFVGKTTSGENKFSDVDGWSLPYIVTAFKEGIINGISENEFNPKGTITREQAATIIARAIEKIGFVFENEPEEFDDEDTISPWAKESVGKLASEGIVSGRGDGTFLPLENMTRAEAAMLIYGAMNRAGGIN